MVAVNKYAQMLAAQLGSSANAGTSEYWANVVVLTPSTEYPYASIGGFALTGETKTRGLNSSNEEWALSAQHGAAAAAELFELAQSLAPGESVYLLPKDSQINIQISRKAEQAEVPAAARPKFATYK